MGEDPKIVKTEEKKHTKQVMKRTIQDSVFTNLFSDKKYLIQLYRALHPEDVTTTEENIYNVTIRNILTDGSYNDLGFLVHDVLLILVEAQSTWSANIIVRALMYLMQTYNEYFSTKKVNLYSSKKIKMPKPELYVIYTGERIEKPKFLSLSEEFFDGQECGIDAKVKMIYDGAENDILYQYIAFTRVCKEQIKLHKGSKEAIKEIIHICRNRNILKEYMESREKEVIDIMTTLFDEQEILERYVASEVEEAVEKAVEEAVEKAVEKAVAQTKEEAAIRFTIETCQEFGASTAETVQKLIDKFDLKKSNAETKVKEYWR